MRTVTSSELKANMKDCFNYVAQSDNILVPGVGDKPDIIITTAEKYDKLNSELDQFRKESNSPSRAYSRTNVLNATRKAFNDDTIKFKKNWEFKYKKNEWDREKSILVRASDKLGQNLSYIEPESGHDLILNIYFGREGKIKTSLLPNTDSGILKEFKL
jgi:hypothetical protein